MTTFVNHHKLRLRSQLCAGFSATTGPLPHSSTTSMSSEAEKPRNRLHLSSLLSFPNTWH
ncbi:hypothetical protein F2Q70_00037530 [Brassica cretica]|uniref:Uncharacterized protein n=1 Tax=Brassica cretica TaxID=69181 RepID=A0A8S9JWQ7_BRACR|nr:hypothetical protein F2Q70_00037530 [Brassica cretica]